MRSLYAAPASAHCATCSWRDDDVLGQLAPEILRHGEAGHDVVFHSAAMVRRDGQAVLLTGVPA